MKNYLLGIDIGTSELKAGIIDESGTVLTSLKTHNFSSFKEGGKASQDAMSIVRNTTKLIRQVCLKAGVSPENVVALGLDGQMGGIIGVNQDFQPLTGLDMGLDLKAEQINADFHRDHGNELMSISCGSPRNAPKIAWWKRNEPEIYRKVRRFTSLSGFVAGTLTGVKGDDAAIDETMIAYFGNENADKLKWSEELTSLWGLDPGKLPVIGKPWDILGSITTTTSEETGLREGTPVVLGAGDQPAGFLGAGLDKPGTLIDIGGSTAMLTLCVKDFIPDKEKMTLIYMPSVIPGRYFATWYINGGDMVFPWFRDNFAENHSLADLSRMAGKVPPGSEGLLFLPYFTGRQCPYENTLRGSWVGLNLGHQKAHMFRSILEGIAAQYVQGLLSLERLFPELIPESIIGIGGTSKDEIFNLIKANFTQKNYRIQTGFDASLRGSALIAGIGAGIFSLENLPKLPGQEPELTSHPQPEENMVYEKLRSLYSRMEERTLGESFSLLADFPGTGN